ncbi:MAG: hypothetical protein D3M94_00665 [Rhodocyclales bacterium GT-UBC]|nr:MAG: hypothetical protein D3M94_00665 [Rhodocyclales bacterium GT-UBC]
MKTCCPSCHQTMAVEKFKHRMQGEIELDLCFNCQAIWFDNFESVQLAPGGIIELFRLIHAHRDEPRQALSEVLNCPRCNEKLLHGMDIAKGGRFNYHRCLQQHGRFTTFAQFMIEKGFVRQLHEAELDTLKAQIGSIRCNGCGAAIDIKQDHACPHCKAPITILDTGAVEKALATYQQVEAQRSVRDVELLGDAIILREKQRALYERQSRAERYNESAEIGDLVADGIDLVCSLLSD